MRKKYIKPVTENYIVEGVQILASSSGEEGDGVVASGRETTDPNNPNITWTQLSKHHNVWDDGLEEW